MKTMTKLSASILALIIYGCSGDRETETNFSELSTIPKHAELLMKEKLALDRINITEYGPCPQVSTVDHGNPSGPYYHIFLAHCEENGKIYSAIMMDMDDDNANPGQANQEGPLSSLVYTNSSEGSARIRPQGGGSGACAFPFPVDGSSPPVYTTFNYNNCRMLDGVRVEAVD